jgi:uncharacterized protein with ATP-grasp and redox domains
MVEGLPLSSSPPEIARTVNHVIAEITGKKDIYSAIKKWSNIHALEMYDTLKRRIVRAGDPLREAVECAIAGNVIDYGIHDTEWIRRELENVLKAEKKAIERENKKLFRYERFKKELKNARTILYLGDNAGETVFDRLLIETIQSQFKKKKEITYVVKEKPAINDALMADAYASGVQTVATIISSGSDAPGTVLSLCSAPFMKAFREADMVISKGQGNFEALSRVRRDIFFLLMIKCRVIADDITVKAGHCSVGDTILLYHRGEKRSAR